MAIFTFSTKETRPDDAVVVKKVKDHCYRNGINFSAIVVTALRTYLKEEEAKHGRTN